MKLLLVFFKDTCTYCHKLINEPFEKTAADCGAKAIFIDATNLNDCPFKDMFDANKGVPQTNLVTLSVDKQIVGYLPQPQHSAQLCGGVQ
jgi:hypothetical protein